ncbi:MAG TPA: BadF/BadG/BcrA/BcrD ATPase family protein [Streptosporangiaceae bacterium]
MSHSASLTGPRVVVGMDAGGTKLAVQVETLEGQHCGFAEFAASDWEASPAAAAAGWLDRHLRRALPPGAEVVSVGIGAQGCNTPEISHALEQALAARGLAATVVNDGALLVPAAGFEAGIGIIAGTGSVGIGADASGTVIRAGGWGWALGDEGGAAAIVREATRAALLAHDSSMPDDGLLAALQQSYGVSTAEELARAVNDEPTVANWAPHAPVVFAAADGGSARAIAVITAAAQALTALVGRLIGRGAVGTVVVAAGSVITRQPRLAQAFGEAIGHRHPQLEFCLLDTPPVTGAIILARRMLASGHVE